MATQPIDAECFRTPVPLRRNRLHWFAGRAHEILDDLGDPPTWALTRASDAVANPARPDPIPREEAATSPGIRGRAFCELLERYPVDRPPARPVVWPRLPG